MRTILNKYTLQKAKSNLDQLIIPFLDTKSDHRMHALKLQPNIFRAKGEAIPISNYNGLGS